MSGLVRAEPLFRARRRAQQRRTARSLLALATATTVVGGATWVGLYSPVLRTTGITVEGTSRLSTADVLAAARVRLGGSLLRVPVDAVHDRVAALAPVASVVVHRAWPHRVAIEVTERVPVAAVQTPSGSVLLDAGGTAFAIAPAGVGPWLQLRVPAPAPGQSNDTARAALAVWAVLPGAVRSRLDWLAADTPDDVQFRMVDGTTVTWGSAADPSAKLAVLAALMRRPGRFYDVSTPDVAVVR